MHVKNIKRSRAFRLMLTFVAAMLSCGVSNAQSYSISGIVTDNEGHPIHKSIVKYGENRNVEVGENGIFEIEDFVDGELTIESIGYIPKVITAKRGKFVNVKLEKSIIDEKIDVPFGKVKFLNNTGGISFVNNSELSMPVLSFSNVLTGKIAGLTTYFNSGEPGEDGASLFIRGRGTYNNNNILVYVDGFQSSIDQLSSAEVETVSVFKDAASLAQFGIEGANGVLWVTTKRGKAGKLRINLNQKFGAQQQIKRAQFLDSYNYARLYNEAVSNDQGRWNPVYSEADLQKYKEGTDPVLYPNVNWYKEALRTNAPFSETNLSLQGGGNNIVYAVYLGYKNSGFLYKTENSYIKNLKDVEKNEYNQYSYRANADIDINKIFSVSADLGGVVIQTTSPNFPVNSLWNSMASYPPNIYPVRNPNNTWGGNTVYPNNPIASIFDKGTKSLHRRFTQTNLNLIQNLNMYIKGLSLKEGISFVDYFDGFYNKSKDYQRNQPYLVQGDSIQYTVLGEDTEFVISDGFNNASQRLQFYVKADWERSFDRHDIFATVSFRQNRLILSGLNAPFIKQSIHGQFNYNCAEKYILDFSYSLSGSENFDTGKRFGFFPAVSGAWVLTKEEFMKKYPWLTLFKLKASYGIVGNDNISNRRFLYQSYFAGSSASRYLLGYTANSLQSPLSEIVVGNPDVTWEKSNKFNLGLDLVAWKRLFVSLNTFYDKRTGILTQRSATVPAVFGNVLPYENVGVVVNKGLELEVKYSNNINVFNYFINADVSGSKNKITYQDEISRSENYLYRTGKPVGQPFGYEYVGFYDITDFDASGNLKEGIAIPSYPVRPGDLRYKDQNRDNVIDEDDQIAIGYSNLPEIWASLNIGFKVKGFDLNAFFYGVANRSIYLNGTNAWAFYNNSGVPKIAENRWAYYPDQGIDTRSTASYPRLSTEINENNYTRSTFWTKDGSFIRLKNIEFGYSLSSRLMSRLGVKNLRFYVGANNLLTFDKVKDYDPESISGYPMTKDFYSGISVNF